MAAICHSIPRTTLQHWLTGRVIHGTKPGPPPYLNNDEEANLAELAIEFWKLCQMLDMARLRSISKIW